MKYRSTRGGVSGLSFKDAVISGLADDGGLLVPESIPQVGPYLAEWAQLDFRGLCVEVLALFCDDFSRAELGEIVQDAYRSFAADDVVQFAQAGDVQVMELFHGPTLAFKDVALQLLGCFFDRILSERGERLNILGATSGDTGSAAIAGVRSLSNVDIYIMFPKGRVSPLQELQMTTVLDSNVHCISVDGSFDDCQSMMKTLFADTEFKRRYSLGAVNSVNWARVLAQIVYYAYASLKYARDDQPVSFCVPTGNFGNVFAGYMASRMGFPIRHLVIATNENDILARFFATGRYARGSVRYTMTPAMDIQVASNFERYLFYLFAEDGAATRGFVEDFLRDGAATADSPSCDDVIRATAVTEAETAEAICRVYADSGYVADPHTAVGIAAAERFAELAPLLCVATAHPAKFPEAVENATGQPQGSVVHPSLQALQDKESRLESLPADLEAVRQFVSQRAR